MVTEEEKKQILKNEERLWDLAALTTAPTIYNLLKDSMPLDFSALEFVSKEAYDLADALILERRKRLTQEIKKS